MKTLRTLGRTPANVVPHLSMNFVKGVVYSRELLRQSIEELIEELSDEGVVRVEKVSRMPDCVYRPSSSPSIGLRESVAGFCAFTYPVQSLLLYQQYGYTTKTCHQAKKGLPALFFNCGKVKRNGSVQCVAKCANCGGPHAVSSKSCDQSVSETEVLTLQRKINCLSRKRETEFCVVEHTKACLLPPPLRYPVVVTVMLSTPLQRHPLGPALLGKCLWRHPCPFGAFSVATPIRKLGRFIQQPPGPPKCLP